MNYIGLNSCDTANGLGVRVSIFVSGCTLKCKGCFNPESHDFNAGQKFTAETKQKIFNWFDKNNYLDGLSILGGDPLEEQNIEEVTALCREFKEKFPSKTIWLWTGRKYEKLSDKPIFRYIDTVIDGPFVEKLKISGDWRGSSNQRIITLN